MIKRAELIKCSSYLACIEALKEKISNAQTQPSVKRKRIIFCEDKFTVTAEKALCGAMGGSFDTDVTTFRRYLSKKVKAEKVLSKCGSAIILKKLLKENSAEFKIFGRKNYINLPACIYELICQLKSADVTFGELFDCADKTEGILKDKLYDIATAYKLYEEELGDNWKDSGSYLGELPPLIEKDEELPDLEIILLGYSSWTAQAREIVSSLVKCAKEVTLITVGGENKGIYLNEAADKFIKICRKNDVECKTAIFDLTVNDAIDSIKKYMYNPEIFSSGYKRKLTDGIFLYTANDITEECEYIVRIIKDSVINKNMRYKDFAVAVGNIDEYNEIFTGICEDYGIPVFSDVKKKITESAIYDYITYFLQSVDKNFDKNEVTPFILSPFFPFEKSLKDGYLSSAAEIGVNRMRFFKEISEEFNGITAFFNECKKISVKKGSALKFGESLKKLLEISHAEKTLDKISEGLDLNGRKYESAFLKQAWGKIIQLIDEISLLSGDAILNIKEYLSLLSAGGAASEISLIPQSNDAVYFAELKEIRLRKVKTLLAMGLNGEVPFGKADTAMLNDNDLDRLEKLNLLIEPKISLANDRERENLCLALMSWTDRLVLSRSLTDSKGNKIAKSEIIDYFNAIFDLESCSADKYLIHNYKITADRNRRNYLSSLDYLCLRPSLKKFAEEISAYRDGFNASIEAPSAFFYALPEMADSLNGIINGFSKGETQIYLDKPTVYNEISASKLERYFSCPYKQFADYILGLNTQETYEVKALDSGNILHSIVELYVKNIDKVHDEESSDRLTSEITENVISLQQYSRFKENANTAYALDSVKEEAKRACFAIYEQFENSDFKNLGCEVGFGKGRTFPPVKLKGINGDVDVIGKIDRVDVSDNYVRLIDYKTGNVGKILEKFYTGNKLQLYLYLSALKQTGKIPAGAYYYQLSDNYSLPDEPKYVFEGKTLADLDVVSRMDKSFGESMDKSALFGVALKNDGGWTAKSRVLSKEDMQAFMDYASEISAGGLKEMQEGFIAPTPYSGSCEYCEYGGLCGFACNVTGTERSVDKVDEKVITDAVLSLNNKETEGKNE